MVENDYSTPYLRILRMCFKSQKGDTPQVPANTEGSHMVYYYYAIDCEMVHVLKQFHSLNHHNILF
jgi:hypothetical protein